MFSQMFTSMEGEGPFGGGKEMGVWRSLLTDEYSKSFAKKGGVGVGKWSQKVPLSIRNAVTAQQKLLAAGRIKGIPQAVK